MKIKLNRELNAKARRISENIFRAIAMRTLAIFLLIYFVDYSSSDRITDDAIIVEAAVNITSKSATARSKRQFFFTVESAPRVSYAGGEGYACLTSRGVLGTCQSFRKCYPFFKYPEPIVRYPVLNAWDAWVLGNHDTCTFYTDDGREAHGACCTNSLVSTPVADGSVDQPVAEPSKVEKPVIQQIIPNYPSLVWPPPIPTHPPDHAAPTHPPVHFGHPFVTTQRPSIATTPPSTSKATPWPTRLPPPTTTTRRKPISSLTTESTINEIPPITSIGSCGAKNGFQDQNRIVGGQNADPNEWPWIAVLFNGGRQFCGGSLIDDIHILSAAHCVAHFSAWDVSRLTVHLGDHNIRSQSEVQHVTRKVKRIVRHRGFDSRTLYNDIAILTLDQPVPFSKSIKPVCLPTGGQPYNGLDGTVVGWGSLRENGPQPSVLQEVVLPIWTNGECRQKYGPAAPGGIIETMVCAGRAAKDSCSGDSGGPLVVNEGRWTQIGIVSWGIGCGKGQYPGVYTRVTSFLPWITKNTQEI